MDALHFSKLGQRQGTCYPSVIIHERCAAIRSEVGDEAGSVVRFVASILRAEIAGIKPVGQVHTGARQITYS
jgi:hypothetical protein